MAKKAYVLDEQMFNRLRDVGNQFEVVKAASRATHRRARPPVLVPPVFKLVKTTEAHGKGQVKPCEIYGGTEQGTETGTGNEIDCYNRFGDLETDKWAIAVSWGGKFELISGEC